MAFPDIEDLLKRHERFPKCSCGVCSSFCTNMPGIFDAEHIWRLLNNRVYTMDQLVPLLVEDYYLMGDNEDPIMYLRPRTRAEPAGGLASTIVARSNCIHLTATGCALNRAAMPIECLSAYGCTKRNLVIPGKITKNDVPTVWTTDSAKRLIAYFETVSRRLNPGIKVGKEHVIAERQRMLEDPLLALMTTMAMLSR